MVKTRASDRQAEKQADNTSKLPKASERASGKGDALASLFRKKHETVYDGQKPVGITKPSTNPKPKARSHPLFLKFKTATDDYRTGANISVREDLEGIHDELVARLEGVDINGKELVIEGLPTRSEKERFKAQRSKFSKQFAEDTIDTEFTKADGSVVISAQPLGKTMAHFEKKVRDTKLRLEPMINELQEVDAEIATLLAGLGEDDATKKATAEFEKKVKKLEVEANKALQQTLDDVANARKDDKNMSAESKKKLEDFMKSW